MFHLIWSQDEIVLRGQNSQGTLLNGAVIHGVNFPGRTVVAQEITLQSSARIDRTFETLENLKLYLSGPANEIQTLQTDWPALGGGLEISFDRGRSYQTFSTTFGLESDSSTWITVPASAMGLNGQAGTLGAFDSARFVLQYRIPEAAIEFGVLQVRLEADFDVK